MKSMDNYKTSDKNLSAFLLLQPDLKFIGSEIDEKGVVYFVFFPQDKSEDHSTAFYSKSAKLVQAKDLLDSLKSITDIIFKEKRNLPAYR